MLTSKAVSRSVFLILLSLGISSSFVTMTSPIYAFQNICSTLGTHGRVPKLSMTSSTQDGAGADKNEVWAGAELPLSNDQQIKQATQAVWKAFCDGKSRQIWRLALPLIGATEMDDWPGGDKQRYKACGPMVEKIMMGLPPAQEEADLEEHILDESDAVTLIRLQCKEPKDDASAMVFPTTDTLTFQRQLTKRAGDRLVALVNPAWKSVADFGIWGSSAAKEVLSDFEMTYSLQSLVVYGYKLRLLYCYPGPWRLFRVSEDTGSKELVSSWDECPNNETVEERVFEKYGRPSTGDRLKASAKFLKDSM